MLRAIAMIINEIIDALWAPYREEATLTITRQHTAQMQLKTGDVIWTRYGLDSWSIQEIINNFNNDEYHFYDQNGAILNVTLEDLR